MKKKLISYVKYSKILYRIYYRMFGLIIKLMRILIKTDDKLVLFNSFGGKKYDDSPRVLYEAMLNDSRFKNFRIVWAFHNPKQFSRIRGLETVKTDTFQYFKTALAARIWITNSSIERGLNFKGKNTFYFNTWHGTPLKKMGDDMAEGNTSFKANNMSNIDVMTVQSDYELEIFSRGYGIEKDCFLKSGLPRNDILAKYDKKYLAAARKKIGLPVNKKVILYAPTFREYNQDALHRCVLMPPIDLKKWEEKLNDKYCLLFRAHYEVAKVMNIEESDFVKDVTFYPVLDDLMIAADILISDYSSVFFDFSITGKPMLHFAYDYEEYSQKRGMYFDIRSYLSGAQNEEEMIELLLNIDTVKEIKKSKHFRDMYVNYYGHGTELVLNCIAENLSIQEENNVPKKLCKDTGEEVNEI